MCSNYPVFVQAISNTVSPQDTVTEITLNCDMRYYIHPDTDFQWMRGGQRINPNDKYNITYSEGFPQRGQMGGNDLVSSRFSSLMIRNLESSDSGNYTCFVEGTDQSVNFQLNINDPGKTNQLNL